MISTGELKKGATIELDGKLMSILEYNHIKTGRGSAQVRIKFRDARTGAIFEQTFQAGTKWPRARVETREMQYLYGDDQFYYFMNTEDFEQFPVTRDKIGDSALYLKENDTCQLVMYGEEVIGVELPLGPGRAIGELLLQYGSLDHTATGDAHTGAITLGLGYRLVL